MHTYTHKHWFGLEPRHMEGLLYQFFVFLILLFLSFRVIPLKRAFIFCVNSKEMNATH